MINNNPQSAVETSHPNRGVDYGLNMLGIRDRAACEMLARDDVTYDSGLIVCRPDWVIRNSITSIVTVYEYKNRLLATTIPTDYEIAEVIANAITVSDVLRKQRACETTVRAILFYSDRLQREIHIDRHMELSLRYTALEASAPGKPIASTSLAEIVAGMHDVPRNERARLAGIAGHKALRDFGPH
jgi:hypothetical protein